MIVKLGANNRVQDAAWVTPLGFQEVSGQRGYRTHYKHRWTIHEVLLGATEALLNAAIAEHKSDYANITGDVALLFNNGTVTEHVIRYADTINGFTAHITYPGYFPGGWGQKSELFKFRYAVVQLEADVLSSQSDIAYYHTLLRYNLGGYGFTIVEAFTGPPQVQLIKQQQKFTAFQTGKIIGVHGHINPPSPYWPAALQGEQSWWLPETPQFNGRVRKLFYPFSFSYKFESVSPMTGVPSPSP